MPLVYAAILIGVLIFVHELGHFLFAKLFDVKVLRFSIGFGPRIASFTRGETEYMICALPLGGYVQMLGADFEHAEELPEEDRGRSLMTKPIWQRSLVAFAGPLFNLIFPVLLFFSVMVGSTETIPAVVGEVFPEMPAAEAGLQPGDRIVAIDSEPVHYWHDLTAIVTESAEKKLAMTFERDGEQHEVAITPALRRSTAMMGLSVQNFGLIGIEAASYGPTIGIVDPASPAARGGLQSFDRILAIDGEPVTRFEEIQQKVRASEGKPLEMEVFRRKPIDVDFGQFYQQEPVQVTVRPALASAGEAGSREYTIGVFPSEMFVAHVEPDSPAAKAGLQAGDRILRVGGKEYSSWSMMHRQIQNVVNEAVVEATEKRDEKKNIHVSFDVTFQRADGIRTTTLVPEIRWMKDYSDFYRLHLGLGHIGERVSPPTVHFPFWQRLGHAAEYGFKQTVEVTQLTINGFMRLAQGHLSTDNLSGPIGIGQAAAQAGKAGWESFFKMMGSISVSLAILNLLPIPILDGGNLMLYLLEAIKRGPLSFRTRQLAAYVGFVIVIMLVILAFKNDIVRNWDAIAAYINAI